MNLMSRRVAGSLILIGAAQFMVCMMIAEALYAGYSVRDNYISDLGVGPSHAIFNGSIFLFGLLSAIASYIIWRGLGSRLVAGLFFLSALGAMGVGVFTESTGRLHAVVSAIVFLFGGISAIAAYRLEKTPLNYISAIMGLVALGALALFTSGNLLGIGKGGMERMIAYPLVLWAVAFGGHLASAEPRE